MALRSSSSPARGRTRPTRPSGKPDDNLLRQPQLAALLPAGNEDARLRALGRPQLSRAGQRHHPDRCGQQRARLRHRLWRAAAPRRDRAPAAAVRRPADQLRTDSCELHGGRGRFHRVETRPTIARALRSQSRSGSVKCSRHRRSGGATVAVRTRDHCGHDGPGARRASTPSRPPRAPRPRCRTCWRDGAIRPEETTVVVLTGTGLKATQRIQELLEAGPPL